MHRARDIARFLGILWMLSTGLIATLVSIAAAPTE
jgi:hypothetical protein